MLRGLGLGSWFGKLRRFWIWEVWGLGSSGFEVSGVGVGRVGKGFWPGLSEPMR